MCIVHASVRPSHSAAAPGHSALAARAVHAGQISLASPVVAGPWPTGCALAPRAQLAVIVGDDIAQTLDTGVDLAFSRPVQPYEKHVA
jgi:hypothetical protein